MTCGVDVVVGAPYDDGGRGAVYLYLGGAKDIFSRGYAQKFQSTRHSGFGYSLTPRAADVDGNSYPGIDVFLYLYVFLYICIYIFIFLFMYFCIM